MKSTARPVAAAKERFRTCLAGHRRIEIGIEIEIEIGIGIGIGIDWFHATRKAHPIDPDFDFDFDFDLHSCAPCEELTGE